MAEKLLLRQGLLDQHQADSSSPARRSASSRVYAALASTWSSVAARTAPAPPHPVDVEAGLDLELDAAVPLVHVAGHRLQSSSVAVGDAHRGPAVHLGAHRPEVLGQRPARRRAPGQPGHLQGGLGHPVTRTDASTSPSSAAVARSRAISRGRRCCRISCSAAWCTRTSSPARPWPPTPPALAGLAEEDGSGGRRGRSGPEPGPKRGHQGDGDPDQLHRLDLRSGPGSAPPSGREAGVADRVISAASVASAETAPAAPNRSQSVQLQPDVAPQLWHL